MSSTIYRAAVIGLGRMGSTFDDEIKQGGQFFMPYCHAPSYVASPHTELIAGVDPHAEQGKIFAERWGLSERQIYADYKEMLEKERPDFVSVCTTARHRAVIMQDAINAGGQGDLGRETLYDQPGRSRQRDRPRQPQGRRRRRQLLAPL